MLRYKDNTEAFLDVTPSFISKVASQLQLGSMSTLLLAFLDAFCEQVEDWQLESRARRQELQSQAGHQAAVR